MVLGQGGIDRGVPAGQIVAAAAAEDGRDDLPENGLDLDEYLGEIEKDILLKALDDSGVRKKAAELLGITFRSIRYRLAKFDIAGEDDVEE